MITKGKKDLKIAEIPVMSPHQEVNFGEKVCSIFTVLYFPRKKKIDAMKKKLFQKAS